MTGDTSTGTDTLRSIEGVQGTNFADTFDATGYGLAGALNVGNVGNFNQFEGLAGNDTITGNGDTRVLYSNASAGVTIAIGAAGTGSAHGTAAGDAAGVGTDTFNGGVNSATGSNFADVYNATALSLARAPLTHSKARVATTPSPATATRRSSTAMPPPA